MKKGTEIIAISAYRILHFESVSEASRYFDVDRAVIRRLIEQELPIKHSGAEWWIDETVEVTCQKQENQ